MVTFSRAGQDFTSNLLEWNTPALPLNDKTFTLAYSPDGMELNYPMLADKNKEWFSTWYIPKNVIELSGDAIVEANFDRRVRFSGLHFYTESTKYENSFGIIVSQGERATWKTNSAGLGYLRSSQKSNPWDDLGSIEQILKSSNGNVLLKVQFKGDKMSVYVNNKLVATRTNDLFNGKKYFSGIVVGNGDNFVVNSIKVWVMKADDFIITPFKYAP